MKLAKFSMQMKLACFFKLLPDKTPTLKNKPCLGGEQSKDQITVLVGSNSDGSEKLPLLVIGKSKSHRCFKNVRLLCGFIS